MSQLERVTPGGQNGLNLDTCVRRHFQPTCCWGHPLFCSQNKSDGKSWASKTPKALILSQEWMRNLNGNCPYHTVSGQEKTESIRSENQPTLPDNWLWLLSCGNSPALRWLTSRGMGVLLYPISTKLSMRTLKQRQQPIIHREGIWWNTLFYLMWNSL